MIFAVASYQMGKVQKHFNRTHLGVKPRGKADDHAHAQHQRSIAAVDGDLHMHRAMVVTPTRGCHQQANLRMPQHDD
jgi:hypothetical protein